MFMLCIIILTCSSAVINITSSRRLKLIISVEKIIKNSDTVK